MFTKEELVALQSPLQSRVQPTTNPISPEIPSIVTSTVIPSPPTVIPTEIPCTPTPIFSPQPLGSPVRPRVSLSRLSDSFLLLDSELWANTPTSTIPPLSPVSNLDSRGLQKFES